MMKLSRNDNMLKRERLDLKHKMLLEPKLIDLKYKTIDNESVIKNLLLVHDKVKNYNDFVNACNEQTYSIVYDDSSSSHELLSILSTKFSSIDRLCFVFDELHIANTKGFINNKPLFTDSDLNADYDNLSDNFKLVIDLCKNLNIKNVDFLACNTLNYSKWVSYYEKLNSLTKTDLNIDGVIIGASNDKTGNIKHGGDWTLESSGEDIKTVYFTEQIKNYSSTLGVINASGNINIKQLDDGIIQYQNVSVSSDWITIDIDDWPMGVNNQDSSLGAILTISFTTPITLTDSSMYFICGSPYITFDGNAKIVNVQMVPNYPGLIQNGTDVGTDLYSNITVQNITMNCESSSLADFGGWICQQYFGSRQTNCNVSDCSSDGVIGVGAGEGGGGILGAYAAANVNNCHSAGLVNYYSGGIFGSHANYYSSSLCTATNCYSMGIITSDSGGIFGPLANMNSTGSCIATNCHSVSTINDSGGIFAREANTESSGSCTATNCYSTGNINGGSGGIFDIYANSESSGSCTATNCYSIGIIDDNAGGGGIFAASANRYFSGSCTATNCYSAGTIGERTGGIFGEFANNLSTGFCIAISCYSTGNIGNSAGGIFGPDANTDSLSSCTATNCYSVGTVGDGSRGIFGSNPYSLCTALNCYIANNEWKDSEANEAFASIENLSRWVDINVNSPTVPYLLASFNTNFYVGDLTSATVPVNTYTNLNLNTPARVFTVSNPNISINVDGQMRSLIAGNYVTYVINGYMSEGTYYGYNIINFALTVNIYKKCRKKCCKKCCKKSCKKYCKKYCKKCYKKYCKKCYKKYCKKYCKKCYKKYCKKCTLLLNGIFGCNCFNLFE